MLEKVAAIIREQLNQENVETFMLISGRVLRSFTHL